MGFFNKYPYTDFHELNLDWVLNKVRELQLDFDEFKVLNSITFSGVWDITKQYVAWTIVNDGGVGYISLKPVPVGIDINNSDYWTIVADYSVLIAGMQNRIISLEKNRLAWINALEYGFVTDAPNDAIMAQFIANDADKILYFPQGVYEFDDGFNFPDECHIIIDDDATLKLSDNASGVEYFITVRKGSTASDYTFKSFITGGTIDCNYKADCAFGCHKCRSNILDRIHIKNVLKYGIKTRTEATSDGAITITNLVIENTKDVGEIEVTGTTGIRDDGLDNFFSNIEVINFEKGIYTINSEFVNVSAWIRSQNLLQNSVCVTIDGKSSAFTNLTVDTYRYGFNTAGSDPHTNITNVRFVKNTIVYTAALEALYPITLFTATDNNVIFNVVNCDIRTGAVTFAAATYAKSNFYNVTSNLAVNTTNYGSHVRNDGKRFVSEEWTVNTDAWGQASVQTYVSDKMMSITCPNNVDYLVLRRGSGAIAILAFNQGAGTFAPVTSSSVLIRATWRNIEVE